jgi:2-polyprenyl-6-methoxyphenol hydroxylase-like FAD-dependent oxidoreductase
MMGQDRVEQIVRSHLEKYGSQVELATELRSFEQHPDHVTAHLVIARDGQESIETANYDWIIGADGGRGVLY